MANTVADPVTLATVTAAVTNLALDCAKQVASAGAKDMWAKVRSLLGWSADPAPDKVAKDTAETLAARPDLVAQVIHILKADPTGTAGRLVGHIEADKVVVAGQLYAQSFKM